MKKIKCLQLNLVVKVLYNLVSVFLGVSYTKNCDTLILG